MRTKGNRFCLTQWSWVRPKHLGRGFDSALKCWRMWTCSVHRTGKIILIEWYILFWTKSITLKTQLSILGYMSKSLILQQISHLLLWLLKLDLEVLFVCYELNTKTSNWHFQKAWTGVLWEDSRQIPNESFAAWQHQFKHLPFVFGLDTIQ